MFLFGLSDSLANESGKACPQCGGAAQINDGACVSCLLRGGLGAEGGIATENLEELLSSVDISDSDWRLGNYQILDEIGRGGMGVIYRARQRHSRRIVALKRVLSYHSESRETLERFRREAQAAASLDHPNILPIYEVGEADDLPFFTMKLATGGSLQGAASVLRESARECVRLVMKVTRAVAYAHGEGILHRDLKPGNILLDARGEPLVSDFGLAKWLDGTSDLTRTLTIFGTPGYIAPEQARSAAAELNAAADIYSIGAILFDLLTGRPPFLGEHALSVIKQAEEKPAPKLRSLIKNAGRDLETICAKCLEREPASRYRSAAGLADDLQRWLEGRPIIARPVSPPAQALRWTKRNPLFAAGIGACALFALAAIWMAARSSKLQSSVSNAQAARHSIVIEPVFNLDDVAADQAGAGKLGRTLARKMTAFGPANVSWLENGRLTTAMQRPPAIRSRVRLSSTIREKDGNVRFAVRLVDTANESVLARRVFEISRGTDAETRVAEELAQTIYRMLDSDRLAEPPTADPGIRNPSARDFIVAARELMEHHTNSDFDRAQGCIERALALEPNSATANAYLAFINDYRVASTSNRSSLVLATKAAERALLLDPENGEVQRAAAATDLLSDRIDRALEHCYREVEYSGPGRRSSNTAVQACEELGRPDKAIAWFRLARTYELHPADNDHALGDCWADLCDYNRAATAYQRFSDLHPDQPEGWLGICRLHLLRKDFAMAQKVCDANWTHYPEHPYSKQMAAMVAFFSRRWDEAETLYGELWRSDPSGGGRFYSCVSYESALARIKLQKRDITGAVSLLTKARAHEYSLLADAPRNPDALYRLAAIEACAGNRAPALGELGVAAEAGWIDYRTMQLDPRFDELRDNAEFQAIISRLEHTVTGMRLSLPQKLIFDLRDQMDNDK